jgi:hypothetical protein
MSCQPSPQQIRRQHYLYETGRSVFPPAAAKPLPKPIHKLPSSREILIESAERDGYQLGLEDIHTTPANYRSGEEWIAWYRGWKRGQQERPR